MRYRALRIRGEPCPHEMDGVFRRWVSEARLFDLVFAWESRTWVMNVDSTGLEYMCGPRTFRLNPGMLEHLKRRIADLVLREHGGRWRHSGMILRSDGQRIWTELLA